MHAETSSQDGSIGKHGSPPRTTTVTVTTELQNNCRPESSENQVVWKSTDQGIKGVALIQMDGRSRDAEMWR